MNKVRSGGNLGGSEGCRRAQEYPINKVHGLWGTCFSHQGLRGQGARAEAQISDLQTGLFSRPWDS